MTPKNQPPITHWKDVAIDDIPRDLRFHPSTPDNLTRLTPDQVESYNRDGYLKGFTLFSSEEMADLRSYFDDLLARVLAEGGDGYSINSAHLEYQRVYDLMHDSRIVDYVRDLIGPDIIGWGSHFFCKVPGDPKRVSWHQDATYWPMTPSKVVTVWIAIDDADTENACMRFIPGSHCHGPLDFQQSEEAENNVLFQTVTNPEQYGAPVDVDLKAGQISLHADLLLHGSEPNHSDRRRCGLTLRYCPPDVIAYQGWHEKGFIISGSDPDQHWANPPRPESHEDKPSFG
jgi:non-heme Fe2+,alpha-ketoglutarate-dependent halogenase